MFNKAVCGKSFSRGETTNAEGIPSSMKRWEMCKYGSTDNIYLNEAAPVPVQLKPDQILLKVCASSVNPIDVEMCEGYGSTLINVFRRMYGVQEFPLILGRDGSGVVVKTGKSVSRFRIGDNIWCARWIIGEGTHAEYCVVSQSEASLKPKTLSFVDSAALPYVACTVWPALISRAGLSFERENNKNILILGGSGGVGTFAVQLAKVLGNNVVTTCSVDNFELVKNLGADTVIDYNSDTYENDIGQNGPYDIVLDASKDGQENKIGCSSKTIYVALMPPLLPSVDKNGLPFGLVCSAKEFLQTNINNFFQNKGKYAWGFFYPNGGILNKVAELVDDGKIRSVIDSVHDFENARDAFEHIKYGQTRGKVILNISE